MCDFKHNVKVYITYHIWQTFMFDYKHFSIFHSKFTHLYAVDYDSLLHLSGFKNEILYHGMFSVKMLENLQM